MSPTLNSRTLQIQLRTTTRAHSQTMYTSCYTGIGMKQLCPLDRESNKHLQYVRDQV